MRKNACVSGVVIAWLYTAAHFVMSGVKQPLGNFYGDFLGTFPSWRLSVLLDRLDLYRGSLAEFWALKFGPHPLWHYGPVQHLVTLPLFAFSNLRSAYIAWLLVNRWEEAHPQARRKTEASAPPVLIRRVAV